MRKALPSGTSRIGYASELKVDANPSAYYLAQYALSPVVVEPDLNQKLIVGNFLDPREALAVVTQNRLVVVRDLGNGVYLLRREQP